MTPRLRSQGPQRESRELTSINKFSEGDEGRALAWLLFRILKQTKNLKKKKSQGQHLLLTMVEVLALVH